MALLVAVLGLLAGAHFSDGSFEGTVEKKLMYEDSDIWPVLTDVEDLPSRRAEICVGRSIRTWRDMLCLNGGDMMRTINIR